LRLPSDLIIDNSYVLLLNKDNIIERRPVKIGISNWKFTEIISGLSNKDDIVASVGKAGIEAGVFAIKAEAKK
jgi:HlyD family secretion protein